MSKTRLITDSVGLLAGVAMTAGAVYAISEVYNHMSEGGHHVTCNH